MLRRVSRFCRFVLPLLVLPGPAMGETLVVGDWAQGDLQRWERRDFDGETRLI